MTTIQTILAKYRPKLESLDLELLIAHELKKTREFVLTYPEWIVNRKQESALSRLLIRRLGGEPITYILGHKEFYGLDFLVTKDTLIPRPETELLVEKALQEISNTKDASLNIIDVGTGSGNIIISITKTIERKHLLHDSCYMLYGTDISEKALKIAKYNEKKLEVNKKIKFLQGNLLDPIIRNSKLEIGNSRTIVLANLPYLSKEIYSATAPTVKNFEPKSALVSEKAGLAHYEKLLKQIKLLTDHCSLFTARCFLEISPEQKKSLTSLIKKILPEAKIEFQKDLAGKWRVCMISLI